MLGRALKSQLGRTFATRRLCIDCARVVVRARVRAKDFLAGYDRGVREGLGELTETV